MHTLCVKHTACSNAIDDIKGPIDMSVYLEVNISKVHNKRGSRRKRQVCQSNLQPTPSRLSATAANSAVKGAMTPDVKNAKEA